MKGYLHFDCTTEPPTITGHLEFGPEDYLLPPLFPGQMPEVVCVPPQQLHQPSETVESGKTSE